MVYVGVPGVKALSLTASEKRYGQTYFASNRGRDEANDNEKVTKGLLLSRVEWVG